MSLERSDKLLLTLSVVDRRLGEVKTLYNKIEFTYIFYFFPSFSREETLSKLLWEGVSAHVFEGIYLPASQSPDAG